MTLSKGGNPDIYVMDLGSKQLTQLTNHFGIDTEPTWSADGASLYFTSDRGGRPQIYRMAGQRRQRHAGDLRRQLQRHRQRCRSTARRSPRRRAPATTTASR